MAKYSLEQAKDNLRSWTTEELLRNRTGVRVKPSTAAEGDEGKVATRKSEVLVQNYLKLNQAQVSRSSKTAREPTARRNSENERSLRSLEPPTRTKRNC